VNCSKINCPKTCVSSLLKNKLGHFVKKNILGKKNKVMSMFSSLG
jgi:hypothetical protein